MTRRERLEKKLEKRRDWAESREAKADAALDGVHRIADGIPFGQPILVGHHSERHARRDQARMESGMHASVDHSKMASRHAQAADGIERQLRTSVFSDDEDAVERLTEIVAELEAERDRWKAYNASCKRGAADPDLLDEKQKATVETIHRVVPYQLGKKGEIGYTNLSATIRQKKKRIEQLTRERAVVAAGGRGAGRHMESRYAGTCADCGGLIERGSRIVWFRLTREAVHADYVDGILAPSCPVEESRTDAELREQFDDLSESDFHPSLDDLEGRPEPGGGRPGRPGIEE